jgi:hypothetical protein
MMLFENEHFYIDGMEGGVFLFNEDERVDFGRQK